MLNSVNYKKLCDWLSEFYQSGVNSEEEISTALINLSLSEIADSNTHKYKLNSEIELLDKTLLNSDVAYSKPLLAAVLALQKHITQRSGKTIDQYLLDNGIEVSATFAELSSQVGYPINGDYII